MKRRNFIKNTSLLSAAGVLTGSVTASAAVSDFSIASSIAKENTRSYWVNLLDKIVRPVLTNIARGKLKKNMPFETGSDYKLPKYVTYLEAVGRTLSGIAPWLALPDDVTPEGVIRKEFKQLALEGIANGVNPASADYLDFRNDSQALVDAAYLCQAFLRAPDALWYPLSAAVKANVLKELRQLRKFPPFYNNWLLFPAIVEAFFLSIDEEYEPIPPQYAIKSIQSWYVGDGWYSDGTSFCTNYYNGYAIHSMLVDVLKVLTDKGKWPKEDYDQALKRMQRYSFLQERMISADGTYPVFGRSIPYRVAAFQPMAQLALTHQLPDDLAPAQVRCALTTIMKKIFSAPGTFDDKGWLQLGLCGHQPELADTYTSTGSLYICTNGFLPLGLPASDPFWADEDVEFSAQKVWAGKHIKKDYQVAY